MTHLTHKIHQLNKVIATEAAKLGLKFVDGPNNEALNFNTSQFVSPFIETNGKKCATYLFAVAEA
jgi:hypothetical protein